MADFRNIETIQTSLSDCEMHRKAVLQLRVAGAAETLTITCPSENDMESLADLIDGYCRLFTDSSSSLWNRKSMFQLRDDWVAPYMLTHLCHTNGF